MKAIHKRDNFSLFVLTSRDMFTPLAGKLERTLVGFSARVGQKHFCGPLTTMLPRGRDQFLGQGAGVLVVEKVAGVDELVGLFIQDLGHLGIGVAQGDDGNTSGKVEVGTAVGVVKVATFSLAKDQVGTSVCFDGVFVETLDSIARAGRNLIVGMGNLRYAKRKIGLLLHQFN